jgi:hypothetical protein
MVQTMDSPPFDLQAYQPPISLWKLVKQYVPDHEREEIKSMLGESLIDQSQELHQEVLLFIFHFSSWFKASLVFRYYKIVSFEHL